MDESRAQAITKIQQGHMQSTYGTSYYGHKTLKGDEASISSKTT